MKIQYSCTKLSISATTNPIILNITSNEIAKIYFDLCCTHSIRNIKVCSNKQALINIINTSERVKINSYDVYNRKHPHFNVGVVYETNLDYAIFETSEGFDLYTENGMLFLVKKSE